MPVSRSDDPADGDDVPDASPSLTLQIDDRYAGERLDKALALLIPDISRSRLQQWVVTGAVSVNGSAVKARHTLAFGDVVRSRRNRHPTRPAHTTGPCRLTCIRG